MCRGSVGGSHAGSRRSYTCTSRLPLVEVRGRWWNGSVRHEALSVEWGWETFTRLLS